MFGSAYGVVARAALVGAGALVMVAVLAAPALAHGGGGSDATNYRSVIKAVTTAAAAQDPAGGEAVEVRGVSWAVLANDSLLQVTNSTDDELTVPGYTGEPYLRVGPDGVFENRNYPATYQNNDRFAQTEIPEHANEDAEPDWQKVSEEPTYAWHDHRIHWMAPTLPPQVKVDATQPVKVNDWVVPFAVGSQELAVTGSLSWEPPPPWWPWLLGGLLLASLPVAPAFLRRDLTQRRRFALKAAGAVFAVVVLINLIHGVDDLIAVPASAGQNVAAAAQTFIPLLIAAWATAKALRARSGAAQALLLGTFALVIPLGLTHTAVLASSQVATTLPEWFSRVAVASQFAVIGPTVLAILASGELRPAQERASSQAGAAPARG